MPKKPLATLADPFSGNRGATRIRLRPRKAEPMQVFDAAPAPLRKWLAEAKRPWSPASCVEVYEKALRQGESPDDALRRLSAVENRMLSRDTSLR